MYHYYIRFSAFNTVLKKSCNGCEEVETDKPITSIEDLEEIAHSIESELEKPGFVVFIDFYALLRKDD